MSSKTRQAWLAFSLIGTVLVAVVAVISLRIQSAEARVSTARRLAAIEADVRLALWRMDTIVTSLLVSESARSPATYTRDDDGHEITRSDGGAGDSLPLHTAVRGRFDIRRDGTVSHSGDLPASLALANNADDDTDADDGKALLAKKAFDWAAADTSERDRTVVALDKAAENEKLADENEQSVYQKNQMEYTQRQLSVNNAVQQANSFEGGYRGQTSDVTADGLVGQVTEAATEAMTAQWIEGELLLLRRVDTGHGASVQGAWIDWKVLVALLTEQVSDLFPESELTPAAVPTANGDNAAHRLAAAPVELHAGDPRVPIATGDANSLPLVAIWIGVFVVLLASGALLSATLGLSDRRASFVTAVTHELRTPLTTLRAYAEMLADPRMTDETKRRRYIDTMQREAIRLGHLVENVLSYSQIEDGKAGLAKDELNVVELLRRIQSRLAERASEGGLELQLVIDGLGARCSLHGDAMAIEQILFNLVDNAAKYARPGDDHTLRLEGTVKGEFIELRVADRGRGIAPADQRKVFTAFSKSAEEAAVSAPGVGLGLALGKRIARRLGGDLVLDAGHRPGTAFVLQLPSSARRPPS